MVVYQLIHNLSTQTCQEIDILPFTQAFGTKAEAEKMKRNILSSLKALAEDNRVAIKSHFSCKPSEYMKYAGFEIRIVKRKVDKGDLIHMLSSVPCGEYHDSQPYVQNHDAAIVTIWDSLRPQDPLAHQGLSWSFNIGKKEPQPTVADDELDDTVCGYWPVALKEEQVED